MTGSFQFSPPQQHLDELHDCGVPQLFDPTLSPRARADETASTRRKLARTKQRLQQQIDDLRKHYAGRKGKSDADLEKALKLRMAPYSLLLKLLLQLEEQVNTLERTLGAGKMLPEPFYFGHLIFGNPDTGEWFLGDEDDRDLWNHTMEVKQQLDDLMKQRDPMVFKQKQIKERLDQIQQRLARDEKKLARRGSRGWILFRLFILLLISIGLIGFGAFRVNEEGGNVVGFGWILVATGGLLFTAIPVLYQGWRWQINNLKEHIKTWKQEIGSLREDVKILQRDYVPLNERCKELHAEFTELRAHFQ